MFWNGLPKVLTWTPSENVDCTEETCLCQEAKTFSWTSLIVSRGVVKHSARGQPKACRWISEAPNWGENVWETFDQILLLLYVYFWSSRFSHIFRKPIIPSLLNQTSWMFWWQSSLCSTYSSQNHESCGNHWKWRLPGCTCSLWVDGNFWPRHYIQ